MWFRNIDERESEIIKYRFTRVIFGAGPSQYLINTISRKHADRYVGGDSEFVKQIKTGFHVDDLAISVTDARDGIDFYTKCKVRFAEASFKIRKWRTTDPELKGILADKEVKFDTSNYKVLRVHWDAIRDALIINFHDFVTGTFLENVTKRQMLGLVASFYDPLGLIQFLTVKDFVSRSM